MENSVKTIRFIMIGHQNNKIIPAIKSRCLLLPIKQITKPELYTILEDIANKEKIMISPEIINIIMNSDGDRFSGIAHSIDTLQMYKNKPTSIIPNQTHYDQLNDLVLSTTTCPSAAK